jgi:hypothetical protein
MKKLKIAILVSLCAAATAGAGELGFYGAYWSPDEVDAGYGAGAKLDFDLGSALDLELRGTYFPDMSDDTGRDLDFEIIAAEAGLRLEIPLDDTSHHTVIYFGGGAGFYFMEVDSDDPGISDVNVDDEVGWYGLGGIEVGVSENAALFAEAMYRSVEATAEGDDFENNIEGHVDIELDGIGANAGVVLYW